ncbi:uncharacterized protein HMPREF1541_04651 [Cyphellophora europaea CBS 101466]|uniref:CRAL-TRIO domain-containing protein n=1 Tax=Cyphellophora europaea (strain CBS 101466) TaxID=1220924 RepID=W2RXJ0_CYPE1|nr:uncharacterized protein HMPREF1541_04651 [Cyphellophora europaea CBS 101466]ETN40374.1 hypothetical protein HMPREF1541_04651 [Cyphellophora europaea CBS 101466]
MATLYRTLTGQSQHSQHSENSHVSKPGANLSKTTTTDPYSGVLNHLTEAQLEKLVEFKEKLEADGWWTAAGINGKPSHDDGTLLRYLRARKFDVNGAYGQFTDTEKWLKEQRVDELYENFDVEHYEQARRMYPQWTGHRDKRGIPIYLFVIKHLDSKAVSKYQKASQAYKNSLPNHKKLDTPAKLLPLFALYHNLLNFVLPFVSSLERPNPEIPVTNSTNIVDITGVGLTQFWNLKNHMQDASVLATAHYPETLDRIFIIGAPAFFPTVWSWIKRWFDPVTVSKIFILGKHEVKPTLERFMDPKDIPKQYGGQLDFQWGDLPHLDDEAKAAVETDGKQGWIAGPCLWLDHKRIVVGSENGKPRRSVEDIEKMKPIVYAADYTEVPVHPERRASSVTSQTIRDKLAQGTATAKLEKIQSENIAPQTAQVVASDAVPAETNIIETAKPEEQAPVPAPAVTIPSHIPPENVRTAPGGSHVNLAPPSEQAAFPQQTAEYISSDSPSPKPAEKPATTAPAPATTGAVAGAAAGVAAVATAEPIEAAAPALTNGVKHTSEPPQQQSQSQSQSQSQPQPSSEPAFNHAAAIPQPGPAPAHQVQITNAVAQKLAAGGDSVSSVPAQPNGSLAHPEILVSSDKSKGLAVEKEKIEELPAPQRPQMDRFVTAAEF